MILTNLENLKLSQLLAWRINLRAEATHYLRKKNKKKVYFFNDLNIENLISFKKKKN